MGRSCGSINCDGILDVTRIGKISCHVKSRQVLMQESKIFVDGSTITSHVKRIRKKFMQVDKDFDCIETVYGMGYRWNVDPAVSN